MTLKIISPEHPGAEEHEFILLRVVENTIVPTKAKLQYSFMLNSNQSIEDKIAYTKAVEFWVDTAVTDLVVVEATCEAGYTITTNIDNSCMVCPAYPSNTAIADLLFYKLTSILNGKGELITLTFKTDDSKHISIVESLTEQFTDNYIDDMYYPLPWWKRPTFECFDITNQEYNEDEDVREFVNSPDTLELFINHIKSQVKELSSDTAQKEQKVIKMLSKWRPKVVK